MTNRSGRRRRNASAPQARSLHAQAGRAHASGCRVESLEPRMVLAAVAWDGGGDGASWHDPLNWSNNQLPTAADDVTINVPASPTIAYTTGLSSIRSLSCSELLQVSGGTLSIAQPSSIAGPFALIGGTIAGAGDLTVTGTMTWTGGSMEGNGRTIIAAGGSLNVSGSVLNLWRNLDNAGSVLWNSGRFDLINATLTNLAGGVFTAAASDSFNSLSGVSGFVNTGTMNRIGGGTTTFAAPVSFANNGLVNVLGGALVALGGGVSAGSFDVAGALVLGGNHALFASSSVTGLGTVGFLSGSTIVNGIFAPAAVSFQGADVTFNGTFAPTQPVTFTAGTVTLNTVFAPSEPVNIAGGVVNVNASQSWPTLNLTGGTLAGSGTLELATNLEWLAGTMSGTGRTRVGSLGSLALPGGGSRLLSRTLDNAGLASWTGGDLPFNDGVLNNLAGATFYLDTGSSMTSVGGTNVFSNAGMLVKVHSATTIAAGITFSNTGELNASAGTLSIGGPVAEISGEALTGGRWVVTGGGYVQLPTSVQHNAAIVTLGGNGILAGFSPSSNSGTITIRDGRGFSFAQPFVNTGTFHVVNTGAGTSSFSNNGILTVEQNGSFTLSGDGTHTGTFESVSGTLLFSGTQAFAPGSRVQGAGAVTFNGGSYVVEGAFAGTGTLTLNSVVMELNTATTLTNLALNSSTIQGSGELTLLGTMTWSNWTMRGSGRTVLGPGATLNWTSGSSARLERPFDVEGSLLLVSQTLFLNAATFTVLPGGVLTTSSATFSPSGGTNTLHNRGQFIVTNGQTIINSGVQLTNDGTLRIESGNLVINGGGSSTGSFDTWGGSVQFNGGFTFTATSTVTGRQSVSLGGGTYTIAGSFELESYLALSSATASFESNVMLRELYGSSSTLTGPGDVTVSQRIEWSGGQLAGSGRLTLLSTATNSAVGGTVVVGRQVENFGFMQFNSVSLTLDHGALTNFAGAAMRFHQTTLSSAPDQTNPIGSMGTMEFSGQCVIAGGVRVLNAGAMLVLGNAHLTLDGATVQMGGLSVGEGSSNAFLTVNAIQSFAPGSTFTIGVNSTAIFNVDQTLSGSTTLAGTMSGPGNLVVAGPFAWNGGSGTIGGTGDLSILTGSTFAVSGSGSRTLARNTQIATAASVSAVSLSLNGVTVSTLAGGSIVLSNATLNLNTGVLNINAGASLSASSSSNLSFNGTSTLTNRGTFSWTGGSMSGSVVINNEAGASSTFSGLVNSGSAGAISNAAGGVLTLTTAALGTFSLANAGTVTVTGGTTLLGALTNSGTVNVNGGTLNASGVNSGAINVAASATFVSTQSSTSSATLSVQGTLTMDSQGPIAGTVTLVGTLNGSGLTRFTGTFNWVSGTMSGTGRTLMALGSTLNLTQSGNRTLARALDNFGTVNWTAGGLAFNNGTLNNLTSGVINVAISATATRTAGTAVVQNQGTINRSGTGTTTFAAGVAFHNAGLVNVDEGRLALLGSGLHSGIFTVDAGATLELAGTHYGSSLAAINGAGSLLVSSGSFSWDGTVAGLDLFQHTAGTGFVQGNFGPAGAVTIIGGSFTVQSTPFYDGATSTLTGGRWSVGPGGTLIFAAGPVRTIGDAASVTLSGPASRFDALGELEANAGALTLVNGRGFTFVPPGGVFVNSGVFTKSGTGQCSVPATVTFDNVGVVVSSGGSLTFTGPVIQITGSTLAGGEWRVNEPGTLVLPGVQINTNAATVVLSGPGAVFAAIESLAINTGVLQLAQDFALSTGPLTNSGTVLIRSGAWLTVGGSLQNAGVLSVQDGTVIALAGGTQAGSFDIGADGVVLLGGDHVFESSSQVTGGGELAFSTGSTVLGGSINLTGRLVVSGGTVSGTGPLASAVVRVDAGALRLASVATIGALTNDAWLDLGSSAAVQVTGAFVQSATGNLSVDIAGTGSGQYGSLHAANSATVGGGLTVRYVAGFAPAAGDTFQLITGAPVTGTFTSTSIPTAGGGLSSSLIYESAEIRLVITAGADWNNNGIVSVQDIFDFLAGYFAGDPRADFNGSGVISVQDIFDFMATYFRETP